MIYSVDETGDVGSDTGTPVSDRYTSASSRFTGRIDWVQIDIDAAAANADHLISAEERLRLAMARQ
jgi:arylsulfatase